KTRRWAEATRFWRRRPWSASSRGRSRRSSEISPTSNGSWSDSTSGPIDTRKPLEESNCARQQPGPEVGEPAPEEYPRALRPQALRDRQHAPIPGRDRPGQVDLRGGDRGPLHAPGHRRASGTGAGGAGSDHRPPDPVEDAPQPAAQDPGEFLRKGKGARRAGPSSEGIPP